MVIRMWPNRRMETKDTKKERETKVKCVSIHGGWTMLGQLSLRGHFEILDFAMILLAGNRSFESSSFFF